ANRRRRRIIQQCINRELGDRLCLWSRHEDTGADSQFKVTKWSRAGEMLKRFTIRAACDSRIECLDLLLPHRVATDDRSLHFTAADPLNMRQEQFGID